ncbi:hypothetical protein AVEN_216417-1 [Araneus ventricosus]|uniref:Uncharacterized protein n=1 Tax=Araneus ventricosus TaxID=182803 RepID=A0A4Y2H3J7_ARAVE|nr:hypothetical protein AVEN_216417-1 [Araneus ventricosus]
MEQQLAKCLNPLLFYKQESFVQFTFFSASSLAFGFSSTPNNENITVFHCHDKAHPQLLCTKNNNPKLRDSIIACRKEGFHVSVNSSLPPSQTIHQGQAGINSFMKVKTKEINVMRSFVITVRLVRPAH